MILCLAVTRFGAQGFGCSAAGMLGWRGGDDSDENGQRDSSDDGSVLRRCLTGDDTQVATPTVAYPLQQLSPAAILVAVPHCCTLRYSDHAHSGWRGG